jgi:hypothetical protein
VHVDILANPANLAAFEFKDEAVLVLLILAIEGLAAICQFNDDRVAGDMSFANLGLQPLWKRLADARDEFADLILAALKPRDVGNIPRYEPAHFIGHVSQSLIDLAANQVLPDFAHEFGILFGCHVLFSCLAVRAPTCGSRTG